MLELSEGLATCGIASRRMQMRGVSQNDGVNGSEAGYKDVMQLSQCETGESDWTIRLCGNQMR